MQIKVEHILAFTAAGTGGNPAGVVLDAARLDADARQAVAAALGWSETAFVAERDGVLQLAFHTPTRPIPHCGHATVCALASLRAAGRLADGRGSVEIAGERIAVRVAGTHAELALGRARVRPADAAVGEIAPALGLTPAELAGEAPVIVDSGNAFLHVTVDRRRVLEHLVADAAAISALSERLGIVGLYVHSTDGAIPGCDAVARMFAPRFGIAEEAATGVAAGGLAALLIARGLRTADRVAIEQGAMMVVPSPSRLVARVEDESIWIGGETRAVGTLTLELAPSGTASVVALETGRRLAAAEELAPALASATEAARTYLAALPEAPAVRRRAELAPAVLGAPVGAAAALEAFRARYEGTLSGSAGPRYWGFVTGGSTPAALAADWLASTYDQNAANDVGSGATAAEREALDWLRELFALPPSFHAALVTGATMANVTALAAARQWAGERCGVDIAVRGVADVRPRVVAGAAHSSISKALSILGLGREALEPVATRRGRTAVDLDALAESLAADPSRPTIVVASAGEVSTGDFDDLRAVAALCRRHGAWMHVDGAFGLFAALDARRRHRLDGVELADSITVDLHKWLNVPYDAGVAFCRHPRLQRSVFDASAAYLADAGDPMHLTPENSRRFRALPLWVTLRAYGRDGISEWVSRTCALAERLAARLADLRGVEVLSPVHLNVVCFGLAGADAAARDRFLDRVAATGEVFLSPTGFGGRPAVRAALSNWRTEVADVDRAVAAIERSLEQS